MRSRHSRTKLDSRILVEADGRIRREGNGFMGLVTALVRGVISELESGFVNWAVCEYGSGYDFHVLLI
jgi:hypothetical protein